MYAELEEEDDFTELATVPDIQGIIAVYTTNNSLSSFCWHKIKKIINIFSIISVSCINLNYSWDIDLS